MQPTQRRARPQTRRSRFIYTHWNRPENSGVSKEQSAQQRITYIWKRLWGFQQCFRSLFSLSIHHVLLILKTQCLREV